MNHSVSSNGLKCIFELKKVPQKTYLEPRRHAMSNRHTRLGSFGPGPGTEDPSDVSALCFCDAKRASTLNRVESLIHKSEKQNINTNEVQSLFAWVTV